MVDHYDGTSEPLNSAEKKALQSDAAAYDALAARLAVAEAYIEALEQNLNDFVDLKTMDEAIAWRAANREDVAR